MQRHDRGRPASEAHTGGAAQEVQRTHRRCRGNARRGACAPSHREILAAVFEFPGGYLRTVGAISDTARAQGLQLRQLPLVQPDPQKHTSHTIT